MSKDYTISNGVMLNAYPDSIGENLHDIVSMLQMPEFQDVFSLFYILPTFFNSDLDRGFSIIDYHLNDDLVSNEDLKALERLDVQLKFDIVLNHLSVASPQFKDLLRNGENSEYKDFFINWNTFWEGNGSMGEDGIIIPEDKFLQKLFMRKSGLPILKVLFPDGSEKPYWNTFYQQISLHPISPDDLKEIDGISTSAVDGICKMVNTAIRENKNIATLNFKDSNHIKSKILDVVSRNRSYLGQMDVNAKSELVWDFYEETLQKVSDYGGKILRLDAFAYLHKEVGQSNFFNKPGTWDYLSRIKQIADKRDLTLLPEIHAEYGLHLHDEVAKEGYYIYDFFLPGLTIYTIENADSTALISWAHEIILKGYKTINMLGCHDGIPVLDLRGKEVHGTYNKGLLADEQIEEIMTTIMERGGRVKNLYDPSGKKISYYQINATFFSALGEDERKLLLARAIQMFMPGIPQVWYLDIFAGKNDYEAADRGGSGGHKEINRTSLSLRDVKTGLTRAIVLNQLKLMRIRNTSAAFSGTVEFKKTSKTEINIIWSNGDESAQLTADLISRDFSVKYTHNGDTKTLTF